jgi:hypothetical protein
MCEFSVPVGTLWRIPGASSLRSPFDRVTFHFPLASGTGKSTQARKSVNKYAHFIINFNNLRVWYSFIIVFISSH